MVLPTNTMVCASQVKGWSHPAVQKLRHALETEGDGEIFLQSEVETVLLDGAWMSSFLPFPFTPESSEGLRLSAALQWAKEKYPNRQVVQNFLFKFWGPHDAVEDGVLFEKAFQASLTLEVSRAQEWP